MASQGIVVRAPAASTKERNLDFYESVPQYLTNMAGFGVTTWARHHDSPSPEAHFRRTFRASKPVASLDVIVAAIEAKWRKQRVLASARIITIIGTV